jgi:hypothetical protein
MSDLTGTLNAFMKLTDFITAHAVPQGLYHVVRGNAVRELSRLAKVVVETESPGAIPPRHEQSDAINCSLVMIYRESRRLCADANDAFGGCMDVRLALAPAGFRELFSSVTSELGENLTNINMTALSSPVDGRGGAVGARNVEGRAPRTPPARGMPKHVEMMGKAAKLTGLIQHEAANPSGRTITEMCQAVGISRETFQNSKHFEAARVAWHSLKMTRQP